jgi:hypothetical protein
VPTNPPADAPGAASALPTVVPGAGSAESTDLVGDPGSDGPDCPVPARRSPDPARPRYRATVVADPTSGTVDGLSHEGTLEAAREWLPPPEVATKAGQGMSFWEQHLDAYYLGVYVQGARGLSALGPTDQVDCALRRYVAENALAIATPAKLLAALTTVFPNAAAVLVPYGIG